MRIGLLGGSFDPIHRGHVAGARAALAELALDEVLFLPTAVPPHKRERALAPPLRRYAMVELALLDEPRLRVDSAEMAADRPVYTIETLERFRAERPGDEAVLLVGADSLAELDTWRRWREIVASTELGVLARPGFEWAELEPRLAPELRSALAGARLGWVRNAADPASASEIRRRLARGEAPPAGWLEARVLSFVAKYSLYR